MDVRVFFRGLLHFVENADKEDKVKVCVVLPEAVGHSAAVSAFGGAKLLRDGVPVKDPVNIAGKRVSLRFYKAASAPALATSPFEEAVMKQKTMGAVAMEDMIGLFNTDRNLAIVSKKPSQSSGVRSQVLIREGVLSVSPSSGPPQLELPGDLTGLGAQHITMSEKIRLDAAGLVKAEIVVYPLTESTAPEAIYTVESSMDTALLQVEHLCKPDGAINFRDNDFRHHYRLLAKLPNGKFIESMPVPTIVQFSKPADTALEKLIFSKLDFKPGGCNCAGARGLARDIDLEEFV